MGGRDAEQKWRLGRLRRRQRLLLSQQHPLRRSWRAARSADRGRDRPLCRHDGAVGRARARGWNAASHYLRKARRVPDGSWFGRWGVNYIYGTWSALAGLNARRPGPGDETMRARRRSGWSRSRIADGGWGENCDSYKLDYKGYEPAPSTASQTAWALAGADGGGRGGSSRGGARHRLSAGARRSRTGCGARRITPAADSRGSSISIITAIRDSSRSGRWRATATSRPATRGGWRWDCEAPVTVLAVTGLKREALIAGGPGVVAIAGGGDTGSLVEQAQGAARRISRA